MKSYHQLHGAIQKNVVYSYRTFRREHVHAARPRCGPIHQTWPQARYNETEMIEFMEHVLQDGLSCKK